MTINPKTPIGTLVTYVCPIGDCDLNHGFTAPTRSKPWQLGHGEWVVSVEGRTGGYALDDLVLADQSGTSGNQEGQP